MITLEEIYKKLRMNPHRNSYMDEEKKTIRFTFNALGIDNLVTMMIAANQYTYNINVEFDEWGHEYKLMLRFDFSDRKEPIKY